MSGILNILKRMHIAIEDAVRRRTHGVYVDARDLHKVLELFRGMDARERLHYPPHVEMMADAAQKALPHLQGTYAADIMRALDHARPDWRKSEPEAAHLQSEGPLARRRNDASRRR